MRCDSFCDKDYFETKSGVIFKVKSYTHPPGQIVAFPRFLPFEIIPLTFWGHTWKIHGRTYSRFDLRTPSTEDIREVEQAFERLFPEFIRDDEYLGRITAVPVDQVVRYYTPRMALAAIEADGPRDDLERAALRLGEIAEDIGIGRDRLGVTDSMMFRAHTVGFSDVDFVVSGASCFRRLQQHLASGTIDGLTFPTEHEWAESYRSALVKDMPYTPAVYAWHKVRKFEQGVIDGQKFSVFAVRDQSEIRNLYGRPRISLGPVEFVGSVVDAEASVFRPSVYRIILKHVLQGGNLPASVTVVNHRREYIFHAREGESVSVLGWGERVGDELQVTLGSTCLRGRDHITVQQ